MSSRSGSNLEKTSIRTGAVDCSSKYHMASSYHYSYINIIQQMCPEW